MTALKLGKVGFTPKGEWNNNISYEKLDIVSYDNGHKTFLAKKSVPTGIQITNENYWQLLVEQGVSANVDDSVTENAYNNVWSATKSYEENEYLKDQIETIVKEYEDYPVDWVIGGLSTINGGNTDGGGKRIRNLLYIPVNEISYVIIDKNMAISFYFFEESSTGSTNNTIINYTPASQKRIYNIQKIAKEIGEQNNKTANYFRIVTRYEPSVTIEDVNEISSKVIIKRTYLSIQDSNGYFLKYKKENFYKYNNFLKLTQGTILSNSGNFSHTESYLNRAYSEKIPLKYFYRIYSEPPIQIIPRCFQEDYEDLNASGNENYSKKRTKYLGTFNTFVNEFTVKDILEQYPDTNVIRLVVRNEEDIDFINAKNTLTYNNDTNEWTSPRYGATTWAQQLSEWENYNINNLTKKIIIETPFQLEKIYPDLELHGYGSQGQYNDKGGDETTYKNSSRIRIKTPIYIPHSLFIQWPENYQCNYKIYDKYMNLIDTLESWKNTKSFFISIEDFPSVKYMTFFFQKQNKTLLDNNDIKELEENTVIICEGNKQEENINFKLGSPILLQDINENTVNSPSMVAVKYKHENKKRPTCLGWVFKENKEPYRFFWSSDGSNLKELFKWDKTKTDNHTRSSHAYSTGVTYEGDIICVYRGDLAHAVYKLSNRTTTDNRARQNPIIYSLSTNTNNYEGQMIDFKGNNLTPPTSWVMSNGFYAEPGRFFICEYTRPCHDKARVWRVTQPYNDPNNWEEVLSFKTNQAITSDTTDEDYINVQQGFKHCHTIDRDPYTGILWVTTGDRPPSATGNEIGGPGIYYSLDDGTNWTELLFNSEKYCRQLNMIWTEDYIYWSSDSSDITQHFLMRAKRDNNGIIDISSIEDLWQWHDDAASYQICYSEKPHGILFLDRYDSSHFSPLNTYFWNFDKQKMEFIGRINNITNYYSEPNNIYYKNRMGFRVDAVNNYPAPNNIGYICGFGSAPNFIDMPGNIYYSETPGSSGGYVSAQSKMADAIGNVLIQLY